MDIVTCRMTAFWLTLLLLYQEKELMLFGLILLEMGRPFAPCSDCAIDHRP
jgi:hypothetical protein